MTVSGARTLTVLAPGKVNAGLKVGGPQADGYHDLATLYVAVSCYDEITIAPARRLQITVSGPSADQVPSDGSNLAARAAVLLGDRCGIAPSVHIHINKRIPVCGGMAGGSSDAAAVLLACNAMWGTGLGIPELGALGAKLGVDVPFCLLGGAAIGRGRGDLLDPLTVARPFHWVFAISHDGLSTPAMFKALDERRERTASPIAAPVLSDGLLRAFVSGDPHRLASEMVNDFDSVAAELRPSLVDTRRIGLEAGALAGLLAGTGATYAFLAAGAEEARIVGERLWASGNCAAVRIAQGPVPGPEIVVSS
jgi:4-diphosphocytidyl-2-C-methyl-D-erythritol kinase